VVRSRRRTSTQSEDRRRDMSRALEQQGGEFHDRFQERYSKGTGVVHHQSSTSKDMASRDKGKSRVLVLKRFRLDDNNIGVMEIADLGAQAEADSRVSFYFTNFPEFLSVLRLRQEFVVCGIMTGVFLARQRNSRRQVYGFVRFSSVKNVDKLSCALIIYGSETYVCGHTRHTLIGLPLMTRNRRFVHGMSGVTIKE